MPRKSGRATKAIGEAGRKGDDVRSDLHVTVEVSNSGGLEIEIASKVAAFYGSSIRQLAERVAQSFGLAHGRLEIDDKGALPFVIAARIETALTRAGLSGDARPECSVTRTGHTARDRLRRSRLYLPGNEPKFTVNAGLHQPDAIILDLEDSVHPSEKDAARILVRNALRCIDFKGAERMVRINQLPLGYEDLEQVVPEAPDLILIPKVESADQVCAVEESIIQILDRVGIAGPIWLMPILESALGIEHAFAIAKSVGTVAAITIGLEDYTADLGVVKTTEGTESLFARTRLVNAARAAGVQANDSVFGDIGDLAALEAWTIKSRALGFEGMGCLHPRQIPIVNRSYAPSQAELNRAVKIVAAFEAAKAKGLGVVSLGTRMIDPPVVLRAQRVVELARRTGMIATDEDRSSGEGP
jgi:citrate lyase subunit beta/citryl-CoA lyase